jgi:hypothetical protein
MRVHLGLKITQSRARRPNLPDSGGPLMRVHSESLKTFLTSKPKLSIWRKLLILKVEATPGIEPG